MRLENEFIVPAPIERAWETLLDVERIAPCMPGASIASVEGERYVGSMSLKLGPMVNSFEGELRVGETDHDAFRSVMHAEARDARGQGTAAATIASRLEPVNGATRVRVQTDLRISGRLAQFGRGVMEDVSATLMSRFADGLAAELASGEVSTAEAGASTAGVAAVAPLPPPGARAGEPERGRPPVVLEPAGAAGRDADREALDVLAVGREALVGRALAIAAAALALLTIVVALRVSGRRR